MVRLVRDLSEEEGYDAEILHSQRKKTILEPLEFVPFMPLSYVQDRF